MNKKKGLARVSRASRPIQKAGLGARRVLNLMACDTLVIAQQQKTLSPPSDEEHDEKAYERVKNHFQQVYQRFTAADKTLKEFFEFIFKHFGPQVRPQLKRFVLEKQAEQLRAKRISI